VTEFVQHGTIAEHITRNRMLPNDAARFYLAQIVMALQFLHGEHVVFRNLSAFSVWLDRNNYVKLVDFSYAKPMDLDSPTARAWSVCGTPEYMAPEMVSSKGHSKEVDWWAFAVLMFEMLSGYPPFFHQSTLEIYKMVQRNEEVAVPQHVSPPAKDLLKKLFVRAPARRLGSGKNGAEEIKKHKWFRGLNWASLYNQNMSPLPLTFANGDPIGSYTDGEPTGDGVPAISLVRTATGGPDVSNFSHERSPTVTAYPNSAEEQGPLVDPAKDAELFAKWA